MYQGSGRACHNLRHIDNCLAEFDAVKKTAINPTAIEAAIWFHDAVYDPKAIDNEERSAAEASEMLAAMGGGARLNRTVQKLILYTKHNVRPPTIDGRIIVDTDLASLGASPAVFVNTAWAIRMEYRWVPESVFWRKRAEFLQTLLNRKRIFYTEYFFRKYEIKARQNMSRFIMLIERDMRTKAKQ